MALVRTSRATSISSGGDGAIDEGVG
jgi:hypothetical protein